MELKKVTGCICGSLTVDDEEEINLTDEKRQEVLERIFKALKPSDLNYVLQDLVERFGKYECDNRPCECCGDFVTTWTWNV